MVHADSTYPTDCSSHKLYTVFPVLQVNCWRTSVCSNWVSQGSTDYRIHQALILTMHFIGYQNSSHKCILWWQIMIKVQNQAILGFSWNQDEHLFKYLTTSIFLINIFSTCIWFLHKLPFLFVFQTNSQILFSLTMWPSLWSLSILFKVCFYNQHLFSRA